MSYLSPFLAHHTDSSRRILWLLFVAAIAVNAGQSVFYGIMPILGRELGFAEVQVTTLISLSALTFFIATSRWGRYSDAIGRYTVILIGSGGYVLGAIVFAFIAQMGLFGWLSGGVLYAVLLLYRIGHSALISATYPASIAYIADITTHDNRTRGMSLLTAGIACGLVLGPALIYTSYFGFLVPVYIAFSLAAAIVIIVWLYLPDLPPLSLQPVMLRFTDRRYCDIVLIGLTMFCMVGMALATISFYFQDVLQLEGVATMQHVAAAMIISALMMMVSQLFIHRWRRLEKNLLVLGLPLMALSYIMLALSTSQAGLMGAMLLFGFGFGFAKTGFTTSMSLKVPPTEQGAAAGLSASIACLGFVIGPFLAGIAYTIHFTIPYWTAALVITLLSIYTLLWMYRNDKQ